MHPHHDADATIVGVRVETEPANRVRARHHRLRHDAHRDHGERVEAGGNLARVRVDRFDHRVAVQPLAPSDQPDLMFAERLAAAYERGAGPGSKKCSRVDVDGQRDTAARRDLRSGLDSRDAARGRQPRGRRNLAVELHLGTVTEDRRVESEVHELLVPQRFDELYVHDEPPSLGSGVDRQMLRTNADNNAPFPQTAFRG